MNAKSTFPHCRPANGKVVAGLVPSQGAIVLCAKETSFKAVSQLTEIQRTTVMLMSSMQESKYITFETAMPKWLSKVSLYHRLVRRREGVRVDGNHFEKIEM